MQGTASYGEKAGMVKSNVMMGYEARDSVLVPVSVSLSPFWQPWRAVVGELIPCMIP